MTQLPPPPKSANMDEKAKHILDALDLEDRRKSRQTPNLLAVLAPLWIWMAGLIWLPDTMPSFARWLFNLSCWGGFAFLLYKTIQGVRLDRDLGEFKEKSSRRLELEALAEKRRKFQSSASQPPLKD